MSRSLVTQRACQALESIAEGCATSMISSPKLMGPTRPRSYHSATTATATSTRRSSISSRGASNCMAPPIMGNMGRRNSEPMLPTHLSFPYDDVVTTLTFPALSPPFVSYPREIVFLGGAPGSGKGTHSSHIAQLRKFTAPTIVVSDLLNTPACRLLKDQGVMIDDAFVFNTLLSELQKPIYKNGVVVDGFPRTAVQVDYLTNFYNEQCSSLFMSPPRMLFVMLHVDEAASIARQQERGRKALLEQTKAEQQAPAVRTTDVSVAASRQRYQLFEEQYHQVMTLQHRFPFVLVDASPSREQVQARLGMQMAAFPSVL